MPGVHVEQRFRRADQPAGGVDDPDLPQRLRKGLPLNPYDRATFFGGTDVGYTDYAFHDEAAVAA